MKTVAILISLLCLGAVTVAAEAPVVFADRYYIASVLSYVYGPDASEVIKSNILQNGNVFGGPCDIYEQIRVAEKTYSNPERTHCFRGKQEFGYSMRVKPNLLRESWLLKACISLSNERKTFLHFKSTINSAGSDSELIKRTLIIFDPNYIANSSFESALKSKIKTLKSRDEKIKALLLQVCIYPGWQRI